MTDTTAHDWDGCILCAVRALTEGKPREWNVLTVEEMAANPEVTGVILKMGRVPSQFATKPVPYVDLWTGGADRIRITQYGMALENAIMATEPQIGDTLTVRYTGQHMIERGRFAGHETKTFTAEIQRGHH